MRTVAILIDGGHLRTHARKAGKTYDPPFIERFGRACVKSDQVLQRILYYDCAPYTGKAKRPVSGTEHQFQGSDAWLHDLERREHFAVRRGVLKFRGWVPKTSPVGSTRLTDADFNPSFVQKGVDMRIGLDMANYAQTRAVNILSLVTNDTDCVPAMKYARRAGLQITLVHLTNCQPAPELCAHSDFLFPVQFP